MHADISPSSPSWNRAQVWAEHDARASRRRSRHALLTYTSIALLGFSSVVASYRCDQLVLAALCPPAAAPRPSETEAAPPAAAPRPSETEAAPLAPSACSPQRVGWLPCW